MFFSFFYALHSPYFTLYQNDDDDNNNNNNNNNDNNNNNNNNNNGLSCSFVLQRPFHKNGVNFGHKHTAPYFWPKKHPYFNKNADFLY